MKIATAWRQWDRTPASQELARRLTESVCAGADRLGVSHMELWRRLVAKRHLGYEGAVAAVLAESGHLTRSTGQSENPCSGEARTASAAEIPSS